MVNATVLMTLTSLFISVFNSLPKTTYIKMMDVWIMVTFVYPFFIILLHSHMNILKRSGKKRQVLNIDGG